MVRKKLKLQYITGANQRKQSFKHRKEGIIKKLDEIRILCGVDACAIIYDQTNPNPEIYPSNSEVKDVIERFEKLTLKDQTYRSVNQEDFLRQQIAKVEKANKRIIEENHEACMRQVMFKLLGGDMNDYHMSDVDRINLCKYIDQYLKELLYHKNVTLQNPHFETGESSSMAVVTNMPPIPFMATNMAPIPSMAPTTMYEPSRPYSFLNVPYFETGESSSMAMVPNMSQAIVATTMAPILPVAPLFMAPTTLCEASSSKSPQPTNELQCMVSSNLPANFLATNLLSNNNQEIYTPAMNQAIIPSYQGSEQFGFLDVLPNNNNQEVYIPVMGQDQLYNPNQNENRQNGNVDEMMGLAEQMGFPWMEDNHRYNQN